MTEATSSVHPIETTVLSDDWPTYRELRVSYCREEQAATEELYAEIDRQDGKSRLSVLLNCRKYAWFARSNETGLVHVCSNSCRQRWCPICSGGRSSYIVNSITPWIERLRFPRFLTLTLKHSNAPLKQQIDQIYKHFRNLRKDKQFKKYVKGGIWFFQVKLSDHGDQWHPHVHCLITGKYMPHDWIKRKWLRITQSSSIVDIRAVKNKTEVAKYVARYCARPAQLSKYPISIREEIYRALHGRRLCGVWGKAKGISLSPPKFVASEKYTRLGSWSTILSLKCTSSAARQIIKSWLEKLVLPEGVSCQNVDDFINDIPSGHGSEDDEYWEPYLPGYS